MGFLIFYSTDGPVKPLKKVINNAGRLVGLGDSRPTYGRFVITNIKVLG
jgi:hypothetical protein